MNRERCHQNRPESDLALFLALLDGRGNRRIERIDRRKEGALPDGVEGGAELDAS